MGNGVSVAIVSPVLYPGDKSANLAKMEQIFEKENGSMTELFIFPEANIIGGFWKDGDKDYKQLAEDVPEGESCQRICRLAKEHQKFICSGIIEKSGGQYFITHFICGPEGYIGKQRKLYVKKPSDDSILDGGIGIHVFDILGHRCLILACADILLPEGGILSGLEQVSLVISPIDCFYENQHEVIKRIMRVRAMDACACVAAAFGHDPNADNQQVLAGIALNNRGDILAFHPRPSLEDRILKTTLPLEEPKYRWDGVLARSQTLLGLMGDKS